jgi:hypothetical protein
MYRGAVARYRNRYIFDNKTLHSVCSVRISCGVKMYLFLCPQPIPGYMTGVFSRFIVTICTMDFTFYQVCKYFVLILGTIVIWDFNEKCQTKKSLRKC